MYIPKIDGKGKDGKKAPEYAIVLAVEVAKRYLVPLAPEEEDNDLQGEV